MVKHQVDASRAWFSLVCHRVCDCLMTKILGWLEINSVPIFNLTNFRMLSAWWDRTHEIFTHGYAYYTTMMMLKLIWLMLCHAIISHANIDWNLFLKNVEKAFNILGYQQSVFTMHLTCSFLFISPPSTDRPFSCFSEAISKWKFIVL